MTVCRAYITLHNNGFLGYCGQLWLGSEQKCTTSVSLRLTVTPKNLQRVGNTKKITGVTVVHINMYCGN